MDPGFFCPRDDLFLSGRENNARTDETDPWCVQGEISASEDVDNFDEWRSRFKRCKLVKCLKMFIIDL